jgi:hypothetical protein
VGSDSKTFKLNVHLKSGEILWLWARLIFNTLLDASGGHYFQVGSFRILDMEHGGKAGICVAAGGLDV